jgi:hypothetical protein
MDGVAARHGFDDEGEAELTIVLRLLLPRLTGLLARSSGPPMLSGEFGLKATLVGERMSVSDKTMTEGSSDAVVVEGQKYE